MHECELNKSILTVRKTKEPGRYFKEIEPHRPRYSSEPGSSGKTKNTRKQNKEQ